MEYITKKEVDRTAQIVSICISVASMEFMLSLFALFILDFSVFKPIIIAAFLGPLILCFITLMWAIISFINFKSIAYLYNNQSFDFKTVTERDINDRIDLWHISDRDTGELREFLGMKKEEYKEFFERPNEFYEKYNILEND